MSRDRFRGCLLGLACGDAIGGPVEFYRRGRFPVVTGMNGGGKFQLKPGEWTDDTAMALCLAHSLLERNGCDPQDQMQRYWLWANEGHWSSRDYAFGLGKTVASSLMRYKRTGNPLAGSTLPSTAGNGSIMRLAPIAMYFHGHGSLLIEAAELSSKTTHGADECLASCRLLATLIDGCLAGHAKEQAINEAAREASLPGMTRIFEQRFRAAQESEIRGSGYVVECLEAALWCFWHSNSYSEAVLKAANLGDDADTTAAICGQIAGAFYGESNIPTEWLEVLYKGNIIRGISDSIWHEVSQQRSNRMVFRGSTSSMVRGSA